ncbi:Ger(x)C family spore germination protein [Paenibacillus arenilitoris]|uniref:Ger(X)C family spore germination protein n=1 Tax=Paenibacillus arenilitoris TaxID=2772299 RepID=A0A927CQD6_9BACL|nr:Ger(x)C family spore germination protein [Paenibacillus arenilitoris]MBD2872278.1 Ger(x)C family spore germination protein [Paenibacillus arenilitoris]
MGIAKRLVLGFAAVCLAIPLAGCWDNTDINHRVLPVVMGVSKKEGVFRVFLQIPEPGMNRLRIRIVSETGNTITHAVDKISTNMEEHVDLLHVKIILLDKNYAREGVNDSITDFMRAREISSKALVTICDEELPVFFANVKRAMEQRGSTLYDFFEKNAGWNPQIALTRVWQVYRSIHSYTRDVAIPIVRSGKSLMIEHRGSAVIKNGRMVGRLNGDETLLFNAFSGESTQGRIEVMKSASVLIVSNTLHNRIGLRGRTPYMTSVLKLQVVLLETRGNPTNEVIMNELDELLTKRFMTMFQKIQSKQADILGIGQFYRMIIPRERLANWREDYYPRLEMNLRVQTNIQNTGFLNSP